MGKKSQSAIYIFTKSKYEKYVEATEDIICITVYL
jgi:hypothetical protein